MKTLMLLAMTAALSLGIIGSAPAFADTPPKTAHDILGNACTQDQGNAIAGCKADSTTLETGNNSLVKIIVDTILYIAGIISFLFVIIGGIRYITSTGDASRVKAAKDTLLYAIIGLIVTGLAIPIAGFVIGKL